MLNNKKGFTLIELLIVIGIIAILAGVVLVALNPARQFAQTNNTKRGADVANILGAIGQKIVDGRGVWSCDEDGVAGDDPLPAVATNMGNVVAADYDIAACIVPTYIPTLPVDPVAGTSLDPATGDYDTGYTVIVDADGRVTVSAPEAQEVDGVAPDISITR